MLGAFKPLTLYFPVVSVVLSAIVIGGVAVKETIFPLDGEEGTSVISVNVPDTA